MPLPLSDGVIVLRSFAPADRSVLLAGRDEEWARWLGPGSAEPTPTACIDVDGTVVGWVDVDVEPAWLRPGEGNVGYSIFAAHRGHGYAARAVRLLTAALGERGLRQALLVVDVANHASLGVARAAGARPRPDRAMAWFPTAVVFSIATSPADAGDPPTVRTWRSGS